MKDFSKDENISVALHKDALNTASLEQLNPMMHERSPLSPSTSTSLSIQIELQ
jgi:hypothetical protein